jgi:hypothetical protein
MSITTLTRTRSILAFALLGVLATVGIGYAAIPAADGTIRGCYATSGTLLQSKGAARIVDSGEACRSSEKALSWNQKGPKGDTGPQGVQGEQGGKGDTGPQGVQGEQGGKGDTGPQGIQGVAGPAGVSAGDQVFFWAGRGRAGLQNLELSNTLPAGSYVIEVHVEATAFPSSSDPPAKEAVCSVPGAFGSGYFLIMEPTVHDNVYSDTLDVTTAVNHDGGAVTVQCGSGYRAGVDFHATILATKVDSVG